MAPERLARPNAISLQPWSYRDTENCPFCVGHEADTPPELARYRTSDEKLPWSVRVIPNRYPALTIGPPVRPQIRASTPPEGPARGRQEVLIESPRHLVSFTQLDATSAGLAVQAYRDRLATCTTDDQFTCGLIFKNYGPRAGASLGHVHSQFAAFTTVPPTLQTEYTVAANHFQQHGKCLWCALLSAEFEQQSRLVHADEEFAALCPWASRLPYELLIVPRQHAQRFEQLSDPLCQALSVFLTGILARLERLIPSVAYNFFIHSAAFDGGCYDQYHWHIELIPRIATLAGFEWGSGQLINPVPPEQAAEQLRSLEGDRFC